MKLARAYTSAGNIYVSRSSYSSLELDIKAQWDEWQLNQFIGLFLCSKIVSTSTVHYKTRGDNALAITFRMALAAVNLMTAYFLPLSEHHTLASFNATCVNLHSSWLTIGPAHFLRPDESYSLSLDDTDVLAYSDLVPPHHLLLVAPISHGELYVVCSERRPQYCKALWTLDVPSVYDDKCSRRVMLVDTRPWSILDSVLQ